MSDRERSGWIADRLSGARADAERIARELAAKGHLSDAQVEAIAGAVEGAIQRGRELITDALREPQRVLEALRRSSAPGAATAADDGDDARLASLEERVATLERLLARPPRTRHGSEGD